MNHPKDKSREKIQVFVKAVYAGFMIGIGGMVYLAVENMVVYYISNFYIEDGIM